MAMISEMDSDSMDNIDSFFNLLRPASKTVRHLHQRLRLESACAPD